MSILEIDHEANLRLLQINSVTKTTTVYLVLRCITVGLYLPASVWWRCVFCRSNQPYLLVHVILLAPDSDHRSGASSCLSHSLNTWTLMLAIDLQSTPWLRTSLGDTCKCNDLSHLRRSRSGVKFRRYRSNRDVNFDVVPLWMHVFVECMCRWNATSVYSVTSAIIPDRDAATSASSGLEARTTATCRHNSGALCIGRGCRKINQKRHRFSVFWRDAFTNRFLIRSMLL